MGFSFQNGLIFPAEKLPPDHVFSPNKGGREIRILTEDGVSLSAIRYANFKSDRIILFFHGNAGSLDSWRFVYNDLEYLKTDMIILDYRGYGKSGGTISEKGLYLDAKALYAHARGLGYGDSDIVIYGRSIGTGIAVDVAQGKDLAGLILESPYSSLRKMIYREFWFMLPYFYLAYTFDNCRKMASVTARLLVIHGTRDESIPFEYGKELFECYPGPKRFVPIEGGGHNDLDSFPEKREALEAFMRGG
jgi:uncharacterized protein